MSQTQEALDRLRGLDHINIDSFNDFGSRAEALTMARALVARLETPFETVFHISHEVPALQCALKVALDQDVFQTLENGNGNPKSPQQLTRSGDPSYLNRFLRHLVAMHIIGQAGPDLYVPTRHSAALCNPEISSGIDYYRDITSEAFKSLPAFLKDMGYKRPRPTNKTNWQYLLGRYENFYQYLKIYPEIRKTHESFMAANRSRRGSWLDVFPGNTIFDNADSEGALLVDVDMYTLVTFCSG